MIIIPSRAATHQQFERSLWDLVALGGCGQEPDAGIIELVVIQDLWVTQDETTPLKTAENISENGIISGDSDLSCSVKE